MTAQAITAPMGTITLGGEDRMLRFDHEQIRQTELAWQALAGSVMGYLGILHQADRRVYAALCALCYGALASAEKDAGVQIRERMGLAAFDRIADYQTLVKAGGELVASAMAALPAAEDGAKNA